MKIYQAIQEARKLNAWIVHPNGSCFVVGYLPHFKEVTELSPIPVDSDTLHCISINRRDGKLNVCSIGTSDMSLDVKFDANDLIADYTLVVSDAEKAEIVHRYNEQIKNNTTNFLSDMPTHIQNAYRDLYGK